MSDLIKRLEPEFSWDASGPYFCESHAGYREIERRAKELAASLPRVKVTAMSGQGYSGNEANGGIRVEWDGQTQEIFRASEAQ